MRHSTALTHCALTCCVMWGIAFGFILSSAIVFLTTNDDTDQYVTPEMYARNGSSGFHEAAEEAMKWGKTLKAMYTYNDVYEWIIPSDLSAIVHRIPHADVKMSNVCNVSLRIYTSNSLRVSNVNESECSIQHLQTANVSNNILSTNISINSDSVVYLQNTDARQSRMEFQRGNLTLIGGLLSIESFLSAFRVEDLLLIIGSEVALIDSSFKFTNPTCEIFAAPEYIAYKRLFSCVE